MAQPYHETPLARGHGGIAIGIMRWLPIGAFRPIARRALRLRRLCGRPSTLPDRTVVRSAADRAEDAARGAVSPAGPDKVTFQPHGAPQSLQTSFPTQPLAVRIRAGQPAHRGGAARILAGQN